MITLQLNTELSSRWREAQPNRSHRLGGRSAFVSRYKNGQKSYERFYKYGVPSRDNDKPAVKCWYENGQRDYWSYSIDGTEYKRIRWTYVGGSRYNMPMYIETETHSNSTLTT